MELIYIQKVEWFALEDHVKMCQLKGRSEVNILLSIL